MTAGASIRVLVADDQPLARSGLRMILSDTEGIAVIGEAADGAEAVRLAKAHRPDVVLMDVRMPNVDGIAATRQVVALGGPRVLVLTTFDVDEVVYDALKAGASGFLTKDAPEERLVEGIRVVAEGGSLFAPAATRRLVEAFASIRPTAAPPPALTERETDVLLLVAQGRSNAEIGHALHVTENTVKTHVARVLMKLHLRDRVQAVVWAYESGLVRPTRGAPQAGA
jgi:DNA-binding NarL/FixJ family response regulator